MGEMKWNRARSIAAYYKGGNTMQQIAEEFGISRSRVSRIIRFQTGVKPRPRGPAPKGIEDNRN